MLDDTGLDVGLRKDRLDGITARPVVWPSTWVGGGASMAAVFVADVSKRLTMSDSTPSSH